MDSEKWAHFPALPAPLPGEKPRGAGRAELRAAAIYLPGLSLRESPKSPGTGAGAAPLQRFPNFGGLAGAPGVTNGVFSEGKGNFTGIGCAGIAAPVIISIEADGGIPCSLWWQLGT